MEPVRCQHLNLKNLDHGSLRECLNGINWDSDLGAADIPRLESCNSSTSYDVVLSLDSDLGVLEHQNVIIYILHFRDRLLV